MASNIVSQDASKNNDFDTQEFHSLWESWWEALLLLRPAFSQLCTFLWFTVIVAGLTIRTDMLGVSSIIRALKLHPGCYECLIKKFHSSAIKLEALTHLWATVVVPQLFMQPVRCKGRRVLVGDGIKFGKSGRKMPAVKLLHQQSENKAEFIMGHSFQSSSRFPG